MLDYSVLGKGSEYGSSTSNGKLFKESVVNTKLYKNIVNAIKFGEFLDGRKITRTEKIVDYMIYLLDIEEMFARANEQYFAKKLKNNNLKSQIDKKNIGLISRYWDNDDLLVLERTLDEIYYDVKILK
jgi:hypothetical protein